MIVWVSIGRRRRRRRLSGRPILQVWLVRYSQPQILLPVGGGSRTGYGPRDRDLFLFFSFLFLCFFGQIPPAAILRETISYFCAICFILRSDFSFLNPADLYFLFYFFPCV